MNMTVKFPNEAFPHDPLLVADRLEAKAMQTDDPDETARLMSLVNKIRTSSNFRTEQSEDLDQFVLEVSGATAASAPEEDAWTAMPVRLKYDLGGGRQIDLGSYNLSARDLRVALMIGEKSEGEFRRLLAELEAAVQADQSTADLGGAAPAHHHTVRGRCQMTTAEQEAKTDEYVAKTLARAPQLTPDQRQCLTATMKAGAK